MKLISTIFAKFGILLSKLNIPALQKLAAIKNIPALQKVFGLVTKINIKPSLRPLLIILIAVLFITTSLLNRFVFGKDGRIKAALESGQRLEISLATGEIKGTVAEAAQDSTKSKDKHDAKKSADKKDAKKKPDEKKTEESEDLAWVKQDYIGPRLPDEIIAAILEGGTGKKTLSVDTVSIKDISEKPVVVIIIKGLGLSSSSTREALQLPTEITMGYSPYSPSLDMWVKKTKASGHEIILNIPMETSNFKTNNPGPYSLLTQSSDEDNATRLKMLLNLTKGYNAVYSENTEVFTHSINSIRPTLELLSNEGKYFVYGGGYSNYSMIQIANSINYPILVNDLVLDDDISAAAINQKFRELEKIAKDKGYVVVMAHPYPMTIRLIQAWLPTTEEKGIVVKPISLLLGKIFQ